MGISADIAKDWYASLAALAWQVDLGIDEVIGDAPIDRYDLPESNRATAAATSAAAPMPIAMSTAALSPDAAQTQAIETAKAVAASATSLPALHEAMASFDLCELKKGARNTVFADGNAAARVMILGEAPGREEDIEGRPGVGAAGQLLDRMFAAIGLSRSSPVPETAFYVVPALPWRPPGDREATPAEIAMMRPFVERHITLMNPDVIVVMGNTPLFTLTGNKGIMRARGVWASALGKAVLPMLDLNYLLRNPLTKREAWADLLAFQARLRALI